MIIFPLFRSLRRPQVIYKHLLHNIPLPPYMKSIWGFFNKPTQKDVPQIAIFPQFQAWRVELPISSAEFCIRFCITVPMSCITLWKNHPKSHTWNSRVGRVLNRRICAVFENYQRIIDWRVLELRYTFRKYTNGHKESHDMCLFLLHNLHLKSSNLLFHEHSLAFTVEHKWQSPTSPARPRPDSQIVLKPATDQDMATLNHQTYEG